MRTWGCRLTPLGLGKGRRDAGVWTRPITGGARDGGSSLESAPYGQRVVSSSSDCVAKFFKIFMTQFTSAGDFMTTTFWGW